MTRRALVMVGASRRGGVSDAYAEGLVADFERCGIQAALWRTAEHRVADCVGCARCRPEAVGAAAGPRACVIADDMQDLYAMIDAADELHLVCPVYFAGPTGRFKCVLDRLQPYWEYRIGPASRFDRASETKRPAVLHVIGAGGDPFGFGPLETIVRSALGSAGFFLRETVDRIGWGQPAVEGEKRCFSVPTAKRERVDENAERMNENE
ncbi:MAG: NAD(P)H-dependent oxidoreductase [Slackia sp.]|nr:NAD(P)H-dependent oxidoreductase [Slackia sp.]